MRVVVISVVASQLASCGVSAVASVQRVRESNGSTRTICPSMKAPVPVTELVGGSYELGKLMKQKQPALGAVSFEEIFYVDPERNWQVLAGERHGSFVLVLARRIEESDRYEIGQAMELALPCRDLVIEHGSCRLDGKASPDTFSLMDSSSACRGRGQSIPIRAWRLGHGALEELDPRRVGCGGQACEVDQPPGRR